jgi:hypothetical protein
MFYMSYPEVNNPDYSFLLSGQTNFGHVYRASAIIDESPRNADVGVGVHKHARQFANEATKGARANVDVYEIQYGEGFGNFSDANIATMDKARHSSAVVTDFLQDTPDIARALYKNNARTPFMGVYHSIFGYEVSGDKAVQDYVQQGRRIASWLDYLYLAEPKAQHPPAFELASGTVVVPVDPIVRKVTKTEDQVRQELGLEAGEEYIYVVGGGVQTDEQLSTAVDAFSSVSLDGLKFVVATKESGASYRWPADGNVIFHPEAHDAHNIVANAKGVVSKPSMGIVAEAIARRVPLLLTQQTGPAGRINQAMLTEVIGADLPGILDADKSSLGQLSDWLDASAEISERMSRIPCNGAQQVAHEIVQLAKR